MTFEIKVYDEITDELSAHWSDLWSEREFPVFQHLEWCRLWISNFCDEGGNSRVCIVLVLEGVTPVLVLPFIVCTSRGIRSLEFAGRDLGDFNFPVFDQQRLSSDQFAELWPQILRVIPDIDVVCLRRLHFAFDGRKNIFAPFKQSRPDGKCVKIVLSNQAPLSDYVSKKLIKQNRWSWRKLEQNGDVHIETAATKSKYSELIDELISKKVARFSKTGARDIFEQQGVRSFYHSMYGSLGPDIQPHLSSLTVGGEKVALNLGLILKQRFYYLFPSYSDGWSAQFSPGRILLQHLVEMSISNGHSTFDLTTGDEDYKLRWANQQETLFSVIYPVSLIGRFYAIALLSMIWVKQTKFLRRLIMKGRIVLFKRFG